MPHFVIYIVYDGVPQGHLLPHYIGGWLVGNILNTKRVFYSNFDYPSPGPRLLSLHGLHATFCWWGWGTSIYRFGRFNSLWGWGGDFTSLCPIFERLLRGIVTSTDYYSSVLSLKGKFSPFNLLFSLTRSFLCHLTFFFSYLLIDQFSKI